MYIRVCIYVYICVCAMWSWICVRAIDSCRSRSLCHNTQFAARARSSFNMMHPSIFLYGALAARSAHVCSMNNYNTAPYDAAKHTHTSGRGSEIWEVTWPALRCAAHICATAAVRSRALAYIGGASKYRWNRKLYMKIVSGMSARVVWRVQDGGKVLRSDLCAPPESRGGGGDRPGQSRLRGGVIKPNYTININTCWFSA